MLDVIIDTLLDVLKLLPFLFITYLAMEYLEHHSSAKTEKLISEAGAFGPALGALCGIVPQCGFSASASNLYARRLISAGTLIAVYLSTSDEMLPIMISEAAPLPLMLKVLGVKLLCGIVFGYIVDLALGRFFRNGGHTDIHDMCESAHCHCEERGVLYSAFIHTVQIAGYILVITFVLNMAIHLIGEENLGGLILSQPVIGTLIAAVVGLIPNCAASIVITELFLKGAITTGAMLAGLLVGAGVGLMVLFRVNSKRLADNLKLLGILYVSGVLVGILFDLLRISF